MNAAAHLAAGPAAAPIGVLLLHGVGGGKAIWGPRGSDTVATLGRAGYRAVALDFPGYGDAADAGPPTLEAMVAAARACIAAGPLQRWVIVGHSMGGMVAQELLARSSQGIAGLVLACTTAAFGKADGQWQAQFLAERLAPLDAGLGMAGMASRLVPGLVSPNAPAPALAAATAVMAAVPEATYRAALQAIVGFDRRASLVAITVPTLLLAAEHDRTAAPEVMQRLAPRIAGSEYYCLEDAGHIANVEQPQAFNTVLLAFLQRHF